ncbi:MAG: M23 family metallopeptidase [Anaerolineaceae bacterium]
MKLYISLLLILLASGSLTGCASLVPASTPSGLSMDSLTETAEIETSEANLLLPADWQKSMDCSNQVCYFNGHFLLQNPIPGSANQAVDGSYRFGTTQEGLREIHHGVEFANPTGTAVLAAADGKVVHAGDDALVILGMNQNFYGKVVVIEHHLAGITQTVFTLYAHLSEVTVQIGEWVTAGQPIGRVGKSGSAIGSHLHFEVRYGENSYQAAVNPELWLTLASDPHLPPFGALAGIILDTNNEPVRVPNIRLEYSFTEGGAAENYLTLSTYYDGSVTSDPIFDENFAISTLTPGWYRIVLIASGNYYSKWFQIETGKIAVLSIPMK